MRALRAAPHRVPLDRRTEPAAATPAHKSEVMGETKEALQSPIETAPVLQEPVLPCAEPCAGRRWRLSLGFRFKEIQAVLTWRRLMKHIGYGMDPIHGFRFRA